MAKVKLPAGPQELTAEWLTAALRETGTIRDAAVTDFDYEIIAEGVGLVGQLARVRLRYDEPEAGAPASLVGKFPATTQETRDLAKMLRFYEREVRFYEKVAAEVELRTPTRHYSRFDPETSDFVLLLEDMAPARCGDQVDGCPAQEAATLIPEIARFHATWWDHPRLPSMDWIPLGNGPENQSGEQAFQDSWEPFLKKFGDRLPARVLRAGERLATKMIAIENALTVQPMTIVHGDLRYDNLFFGPTGLAVVDWQIVSRMRGTYDVAYFMSQSVNPAARRAREMNVLRSYHDTLLEHGVRDYSFEQCLADYRMTAMFCLAYPVVGGGTLDLANERGVALATALLDRCVATIMDLDCDEMIPA
jgi:hypothetical protein